MLRSVGPVAWSPRWFPGGALPPPIDDLVALGFERDACLRWRDALAEPARALLRPDAFEHDGPLFTEAVLRRRGDEGFFLRLASGATLGGCYELDLPETSARVAAALLHDAYHRLDLAGLQRRYRGVDPAMLADVFEPARPVTSPWGPCDAPGIYRREHASVVVRSSTTTLLVDPVSSLDDLPNLLEVAHDDVAVDAVLVTHGHSDHWSPATLVRRFGDRSPTIIVPRVEQCSLLTPRRFRTDVETLGFRCLDPAWGTTVRVGDIEIDALPFHGEQPTRDEPWPDPVVRAVGNCYRVNTPEFSAFLLVDSGDDPYGSTAEVVARSTRERGPADVTLSCLRRNASPFFGGLAMYWCALSYENLRRLFARWREGALPSVTSGPAGVARALAEGRCLQFLPYAHGFEGVGRVPADIGWDLGEPHEHQACAELTDEAKRLGAPVTVSPWAPGDRALVRRGGLTIERWRGASWQAA